MFAYAYPPVCLIPRILSETYVAIPLSDNSHSATVAEETLVHRHSDFTGSTSKKAA
ncbi:hypothetical protein DPMN_112782 [Dreissena polymorpha]|uniref:Uncharacterized protein n=1 Tax=Dreissena polymorpha TaxID=45954 RepID=A0A9D4QQC0_DREPO|nr:hypothetical protein DPMN_112782 [Dreissena polymorpha]